MELMSTSGGEKTLLESFSLREKNLIFLGSILDALQIDTWRPDIDFASVKKAFTPTAVRKIHQSLIQIWPDLEDYERCHAEDRKSVSGLYIGTYEPEAIFQAVKRHALYSEKIYLIDPFLHPARLRTKFNPLVHPEEHRVNTIKFSFLWLSLFPWIEAGIVNFIRPPTDSAEWIPFSKALQNSELKILNDVTLEAAFRLRKENRLESLRLFFHRVWKDCRDPEDFSEQNTMNLTAELDERIREAKGEWDKIDHDLIKWFGTPGAAISSAGLTGFLPAAPAIAAAAATGAVGLIQSALKRSSFKQRFPASFFLTLKK
jgi:hypothetical protein